jgi:hypothetical protein
MSRNYVKISSDFAATKEKPSQPWNIIRLVESGACSTSKLRQTVDLEVSFLPISYSAQAVI